MFYKTSLEKKNLVPLHKWFICYCFCTLGSNPKSVGLEEWMVEIHKCDSQRKPQWPDVGWRSLWINDSEMSPCPVIDLMDNLMDDLKPSANIFCFNGNKLKINIHKEKEQQNDSTVELKVSALNVLFPDVERGMWFLFFLSNFDNICMCGLLCSMLLKQ